MALWKTAEEWLAAAEEFEASRFYPLSKGLADKARERAYAMDPDLMPDVEE
jgi:hypothetical protein